MINKYFVLFFTCLLLFSCGKSNKKVPVYSEITSEQTEETDTEADEDTSGEIVAVPFTERGRVKYIPVRINGGIKVDMIFDTGCSDAQISIAEARYLAEKGYLTQEDFIGTSNAIIATGDVVADMVINLKEVCIDDKICCHNVRAMVIDNAQAPLLLGNGVLDSVVETVTIDNENKTLNFKLK